MAKSVYRTAQGQIIDMDVLRLVNENVISVGNMGINARGDQVASDGTVTKPRNERMKDHYRNNSVVRYNPNKNLPEPEVQAPVPQEPAPEEPPSVRGNLANTVAIDLVETPPVLKQKTLSRI